MPAVTNCRFEHRYPPVTTTSVNGILIAFVTPSGEVYAEEEGCPPSGSATCIAPLNSSTLTGGFPALAAGSASIWTRGWIRPSPPAERCEGWRSDNGPLSLLRDAERLCSPRWDNLADVGIWPRLATAPVTM
jgi:hypothetical protein